MVSLRFILLFASLMLSLNCFAHSSLRLIDNQEVVRLSNHVKLFEEGERKLSIQEVKQRLAEFEYLPGKNPNYGFHRNAIWLHARFNNLTERKYWVIDIGHSQLDDVVFYLLKDGQVYASSTQGKLSKRQDFRFPTLVSDIPFATDMDLFVRIKSNTSSLVAPLDLQPQQLHKQQLFFDSMLWGMFYGGLFILAIYNLAVYFNIREISLLAYAGYIATVILWQFVWGGHLLQLFANDATVWLGQHSDLIYIFIGISSGLFTSSFLDIQIHAPKTKWYVWISVGVLSVLGITSIFDFLPLFTQNLLVYGVSLFAITSYVAAGFESYFNQFKPARYFIFAWSILYGCALIGMLSLSGLLPSNFFTSYCFQFGVFLEAGLFSIALMEKSRDQLEKEIHQATLDLRNNMELVEEQNARLDIARKDAVEASQVKSQFLANMSHEIRTPLNAILGFSRELGQTSLADNTQEQVRMINSSAANLLDIVNDVLDFSKIEAGKLSLNNQAFAPHELLDDIVSVMSKSAQSNGLEFVFNCAPLPEKLFGDRFRLKQILNNLLSNAVKFTSTGHVSLAVTANMQADNLCELVFIVEDTGIGISQKDKGKLFSAFSQLDDSLNRNFQGTGLGLVICQELVKIMHGKLDVTSEPGQGSNFEVRLQLSRLSHKVHISENEKWQHKKVVLFDPYPAQRQSCASLLQMFGAQVTSIESLSTLRTLTGKFDVLFAAMPQSHLRYRETLLPAITSFKADKKYLIYSGPEPRAQFSQLDRYFIDQIRLPLTASKLLGLNEQAEQASTNALKQRLLALPPANILAVDDMPMNLRLLETWLQDSPLKLTLANTGSEAVSLCEQHEYDLILMDVQMPEIDGLQASKLIRKTELNMGTPIIAVTAHAFKEEQELLLASGMDDYLAKPIDLEELVQQVSAWCRQVQHQPIELASFDWQLALKQANQNSQAAKAYLAEFCAQLPDFQQQIQQSCQQQAYSQLQQWVHKLHGACSYTGVPQLKFLCDQTEGQLKLEQFEQAKQSAMKLTSEIDQVLTQTQEMLAN